MAERRMFAKTIIDSDAFLDMPLSTQALYFHLSMRADDDGFLNNAKKVMRTIGANQNDYDLLIAKKFIIQFPDGICVIKHWRLHNWIRGDRKKDTIYQKQKEMLDVKDNGSYTLTGECQTVDGQVVDSSHTQVRLGKDRLGKDKTYMCAFEELWSIYPRKKEKAKTYKCYQARLKDGYPEEELLKAVINYSEECKKNKTEERYIKLGATFLGINTPFVDYVKGESNGQARLQANGNNELDCAKAFAERFGDEPIDEELPFMP